MPERGFVVAVLAQGSRSRARSSPRSASWRGRPASSPSASSSSPAPGPTRRTYVGKGKLEELKHAFARVGRRVAARRRRARPGAAAPPREPAGGAGRRPHAADPRHLRPARAQRRGQAPGRARAARVQPAADARHVAAPRAPRRRRRHARPRRVAARDRPPPRAAAGLAAQGAAEGAREAARDPPQGAAPLRDADDRARRLHERRQVDAAERAHRRRRLRRQPALRDARPDDARVRARRAGATSSPTRSASSAGCRTSSSRASRRRSRRRSSPTSSCTSPTPPRREERLDGAARARSNGVLDEIGAAELPIELVLNKIDAVDALGRRRLANRFPDALQVSARTGEGLDELRARVAERFADRFEASSCSCRTPRARSSPSSTRSARRSSSARTARTACSIRARLPRARRAPLRAVSRRGVAEQARGRVIELPGHAAARRRRAARRAPTRATPGSTSSRASASSSARASGRSSGPASRSRSRRAMPGSSAALGPRGEARDHDREHARARRLRLPRRAAGDPAQHRPARGVRRRARHADRPARRRRRCPSRAASRSTSCPRASAACAASARPGTE